MRLICPWSSLLLEGAALPETSASSSVALPEGALCTQVLALTGQTRKGGRKGRGALHTPLTSPLPKTWKDPVFSTAFSSLCYLNLIPAAWIPSSDQKILKAGRIRNKKVETQHFHRHVDLPMTFHVASFHLVANALCFSYNCSCAFRALLFWAPRQGLDSSDPT